MNLIKHIWKYEYKHLMAIRKKSTSMGNQRQNPKEGFRPRCNKVCSIYSSGNALK